MLKLNHASKVMSSIPRGIIYRFGCEYAKWILSFVAANTSSYHIISRAKWVGRIVQRLNTIRRVTMPPVTITYNCGLPVTLYYWHRLSILSSHKQSSSFAWNKNTCTIKDKKNLHNSSIYWVDFVSNYFAWQWKINPSGQWDQHEPFIIIEMQAVSIMKLHLKLSSATWRPFWSGQKLSSGYYGLKHKQSHQ